MVRLLLNFDHIKNKFILQRPTVFSFKLTRKKKLLFELDEI